MKNAFFKNTFYLSALTILLIWSNVSYAQDEDLKPSLPPEMVQPNETVLEEGVVVNNSDAEIEELTAIDTVTNGAEIRSMVQRIAQKNLKLNLDNMPSLFFTSYEKKLIIDARNGLVARPPTDSEIAESIEGGGVQAKPRVRGVRELALGGIIYSTSGNWSVWLNGEKITPDRLPPQILDIRVHKDYLKLKWYDSYTNQVFPIKLRTHQRFNIDTRIFLPG